RVLIVNGAHRCSDPDPAGCPGTVTCNNQNMPVRESDVAHHTQNTFHLVHQWLSDHDPATKFLQIHGFDGSNSDAVEIGDGTRNDVYASSVSVLFAKNLRALLPATLRLGVHACQEKTGDPPSRKCGATNVQGQYTNNQYEAPCSSGTTNYRGRFLHLEQALMLRDDNLGDGWDWTQILGAVKTTWGACNMNNGASDCTLGARQTLY